MSSTKFCGENSAQALINQIKARYDGRLPYSNTVPNAPEDGDVFIYTGTTTSSYEKGGVYQYNAGTQLYGWLYDNTYDVYTYSATPSANDTVYDAYGDDTGYVVTSYDSTNNAIEIEGVSYLRDSFYDKVIGAKWVAISKYKIGTGLEVDAATNTLSAKIATTHSLGMTKGGSGTMIGDYGEVNVYQRLKEDNVHDPSSIVSVPYYDSGFRLNTQDNGSYIKGAIYHLDIDTVTPVGTEDPSEEGWYEYNGTYGDDTEYVLSEDTTVDAQKTYYTIEWAIVSANAMTAGDGIDITGDVISSTAPEFVGTQAEWDLLSAAEKSHYLLVNITDSFDSENILYADMPIGTIVPFGGSGAPTMFLLCDGSEVAKATYPELYEVIGDAFGSASDATLFRLPDLRECVPVGVGKNITKSIAAHDRYYLGQFKDDQLQEHKHYIPSMSAPATGGAGCADYTSIINSDNTSSVYTLNVANARTGDTTHGKQVGVNYIIKAKESGMPTDVTEGVRDVVSEMESYSTAETDTGKTWVDGKRIYRKTFNVNNINTTTQASWVTLVQDAWIEDIDIILSCTIMGTFGSSTNGKQRTLCLDTGIKGDILKVYTGYTMSVLDNTCVLEYTKTT